MLNQERRTLNQIRGRLSKQYAQFREIGSKLMQTGIVDWHKETHQYYSQFLSDRTWRDRKKAIQLFDLQNKIMQQAMLLLELEHSIDHEEQKILKVITNEHTDPIGTSTGSGESPDEEINQKTAEGAGSESRAGVR